MTKSTAVAAPDTARLGKALAEEAARFATLGWMRGTSGNLSMVAGWDPLRLLVTASGLDKGELRPQDMVLVDQDGRAVSAAGTSAAGADAGAVARPSAEAALHARVARLTGAGAVVHVHTVASVAMGRRHPGGIAFRDLEMLKGIGRAAHDEEVVLPVIRNSQDMRVLGDRLEAVLDPGVPAVVVAGHGLYAWGADAREARRHTEVVEWLLELELAEGRGR